MPLKTLFLNPPSFENFDGGASSRWPATREIESYWYPVWLAYPAGMLEGSRLLDAPPHHVSAQQTIEILKDYEFLVLFTSTPGWQGDQRMAEAVKAANPKIKVCFVGPPVTTEPERALRECAAIDFVVRREFDYATVEFANGKPLAEILGISYLKNGLVTHTPDRPSVGDLDALPDVTDIYRRDLDVRRYNVPFLLYPFVSLYTTRGCPAQCTFCLWPQTLSGHPWRQRSIEKVAAEMARAKEYWPYVKEFFFDDDTFNIQKARTIALCEKLKPVGITWSCTSRVTTDYDTLKAMKDAGARLMIVGYESGDAQILKNIKKGATVERARAFTRDAKRLGLVVHGDFILGLPGETRETIRRTIDFAKELDCETIQVSIAHAYPGTELYDFAKQNGFIVNEQKMVDEGGHQLAHIEYPGLPRDYVMEMVHRFYDEYYFRPKAVFRIVRKAAFDSVERKRLYKEAKAFLKLRAQRNRYAKALRKEQAAASSLGGNLRLHTPVRRAADSTALAMTLRKYLVLAGVALFGALGDVSLSYGMKRVGAISFERWTQAFTALANPWVILGILLLLAFFAAYLTALSWADLTYVLPATAIGYVVVALLSVWLLNETVTPMRWLGILLVSAGVGFVARGPEITIHAASQETAVDIALPRPRS